MLLVVIYAGSAFMTRLGSSRLRGRESSGGSVDRSIVYLFMAVIVTNEVAVLIACISTGALITLLARGEAELRIRTIIMLVSKALY